MPNLPFGQSPHDDEEILAIQQAFDTSVAGGQKLSPELEQALFSGQSGASSLPPLQIDPSGFQANTAPEIKRPGLLSRIRAQPGGNRALLEMGASLLMSNNFFEGLGKGALAYQNVLDEEQEKRKPTLTKDGEFQVTRDPETGEYSFKRTPVADFAEKQKLLGIQAMIERAKMTQEGLNSRQEDKQAFDAEQDRLDRQLRWDIANAQIASKEALSQVSQGKPPSAGIEKMVVDLEKGANIAEGTVRQGEQVLKSLENGTLKLGLFNNYMNKGKLVTGVGVGPDAIAYSQLEQFIQGLRNAILIDNKGVQTDGDAERAMLEILFAKGDNQAVITNLRQVLSRLRTTRDYNRTQASELRQRQGMGSGGNSPRRKASPSSGATNTGVKWRVIN